MGLFCFTWNNVDNLIWKIVPVRCNFTFMNYQDREVTMVKMLAEGKKASEIAKSLKLSVRTVESYLDRIRDRYEAINASHLVAIFYQKKILS